MIILEVLPLPGRGLLKRENVDLKGGEVYLAQLEKEVMIRERTNLII